MSGGVNSPMRSFLILLLTSAVLINACNKEGNADRLNLQTIPLNDCRTYDFPGDQVRLCFDSVINDSRCPANVVCGWAGTAVCRFSFFKNNQAYPLILATLPIPGMYSKDTIVAGYKLELTDLLPYPGLPPIPPPGNEIRAEVKITKL